MTEVLSLSFNQSDDRKTMYTKMQLMSMAAMMVVSENLALMEMMVVIVPAPATKGKAIGTMVPFLAFLSSLKR